jgi:hypothetical protein
MVAGIHLVGGPDRDLVYGTAEDLRDPPRARSRAKRAVRIMT